MSNIPEVIAREGRTILITDRKGASLGEVERPHGRGIVHQPYVGLRSVADPDLAKDRLDVDLHGPFCDTHLTGYDFVRIALADTPQDVFFAGRQRRQVERIGRRWSVRVHFQAAHFRRVPGRTATRSYHLCTTAAPSAHFFLADCLNLRTSSFRYTSQELPAFGKSYRRREQAYVPGVGGFREDGPARVDGVG